MPWKVLWEAVFPKDGRISPLFGASVVSFWLFIGWSLGLAPAFGSGFASANDVRAIQSTLLESSILEARIRFCSAPDGSDVKRYFFRQTQEKVRLYSAITGTNYDLPACKDLVYVTPAIASLE